MDGEDGLGFRTRGEWTVESVYEINDVVYWQGSSFVARESNHGNEPTFESAVWMVIAKKGEDGKAGKGSTKPFLGTVPLGGIGAPGQKGDPGIVWYGAWDVGTSYPDGAGVSYGGSSYISLIATLGEPPDTHPSIWSVLASGGTGPPGPVGITWLGEWSAITAYAIRDAVQYQGSSYITTQPNTGVPPPSDLTKWDIVASAGAVGPPGPPGSLVVQGIPVLDTLNSTNLPAGSSVDLDATAVAPGTTGYLLAVNYSSSVACKFEIKTIVDGVPLLRVTRMTTGLNGGKAEGVWNSPSHDFVAVVYSAGAGDDGFRVTVTNLDQSFAADVYVEMFWDEV